MNRNKVLNGFLKSLLVIGLAIVIGFFGSIGYIVYKYVSNKHTNTVAGTVIGSPVIDETDAITSANSQPSAAEIPNPASDKKAEDLSISTSDLSDLINAVKPALVSIECHVPYTRYSFWGEPIEYDSTAAGTGFFVSQSDDKLYIATNNHVIDGASAINITLINDEVVPAELVGADIQYDLAVLSLNLSSLSDDALRSIRIATMGCSDSIPVGSMAVAIGNALGYGQSSTVGYISAVDRSVDINGVSKTLIQTDTAINPGNSGGPLLNIYGQVIGINSIKFASEEVEGMGYAIPISTAIPIINDLINYINIPEKEIGYLGIEGKDITQSYATGFNMPLGIYIYSIVDGSPADQSGLYEGDIITAFNGRSVSTMEELQNRISHVRYGEKVTITVMSLSNGEYIEKNVEVILGKRP